MKRVIALAGSNSSTSINKQLVAYAGSLLENVEVDLLDLNDFEMPIYSSDRENTNGQPQLAKDLIELIKNSDGILISLAEYNGAYSGAFKNIFDWISRVEQKTFLGKPMLLMAASPGGRGGASVLAMAEDRFPRHDAQLTGVFSMPSFYNNFKEGAIINEELNEILKNHIQTFSKSL
ncbi:NADPH-dependent FMN reductase [Winogradskyella aurantiaca]|uniref:NADPH-dependent FMN reductase n=1 Tax=Winogradskyella aurantiaca TaxID=2219558 RepID=UPI000E1D5387|nr:NAD(P)H-dependent oxidoreductase [Winogradskyella aurantiaca]